MQHRTQNRRKIDQQLQALQQIAVELIEATTQRDLLDRIVTKAMDLLNSDGGSLYLIENPNNLRFEIAINRSMTFNFAPTAIPADGQSVAAYVHHTSQKVRLEDVYQLPLNCGFQFDPSFDLRMKYRTRTMLAMPLLSSKGEKLGVLQLINRKNNNEEKWPSASEKDLAQMPVYDEDDELLLKSFASLASASIEKSNLYRDIQNLFKGFIRASVQAIETRDPVTAGHSERVAILTVGLAKTISDCKNADVRDIRFSEKQIEEIQCASLLHDFGKISIHEKVLLKAKKLFHEEFLQIRSRIDNFSHAAEIRLLWETLQALQREGRAPTELDLARVSKGIKIQRGKFDGFWKIIADLNEPTILDENRSKQLETLTSLSFPHADGTLGSLLEENEVKRLSINRGSLSADERIAIENHVTSTYEFLKEIPWTTDFSRVPEIAFAHHEKLSGSGYPRRLKADEIPAQSKMMAICDIYDALVASDRPYKKALSEEKALSILETEAKAQSIDARFLRVFIDAKIYQLPEFLQLNQTKKAA